jgi:hypothetical protein
VLAVAVIDGRYPGKRVSVPAAHTSVYGHDGDVLPGNVANPDGELAAAGEWSAPSLELLYGNGRPAL